MRKNNNNNKQMSYVSLTQIQETFLWDIWLLRWVEWVANSMVKSAFHTSEVKRMRIFLRTCSERYLPYFRDWG